jgi:hypothetical protein
VRRTNAAFVGHLSAFLSLPTRSRNIRRLALLDKADLCLARAGRADGVLEGAHRYVQRSLVDDNEIAMALHAQPQSSVERIRKLVNSLLGVSTTPLNLLPGSGDDAVATGQLRKRATREKCRAARCELLAALVAWISRAPP